ncbi:hypothetical protein, partial [Acidithiobacillus ferrivorans]|uniref:hypothetical protein n=1 Tax=Acidithiobacillus ferrivorans TaxID=160808 RepID=UPI00168172D3
IKATNNFHIDQIISDQADRKSKQAVTIKLMAISFSNIVFNFWSLTVESRLHLACTELTPDKAGGLAQTGADN